MQRRMRKMSLEKKELDFMQGNLTVLYRITLFSQLQQQIDALQMKLLEKDSQIQELQLKLDPTYIEKEKSAITVLEDQLKLKDKEVRRFSVY
jgi:hypothetical protein